MEENENKPLSKRARKKQAKIEKKKAKREKRIAEAKFEKEAGRKGAKTTSLVFGILGVVTSVAPVILLVLAFIFAIIVYFVGLLVYLILIFGLLLIGIGYLIYSTMSDNPSMDGYLGIGTKIFDFANGLINGASNIQGLALVICGGVGVAFEITSLILLFISYPALVKRHRIAYTILLILGLIISIIMLVIGITHL